MARTKTTKFKNTPTPSESEDETQTELEEEIQEERSKGKGKKIKKQTAPTCARGRGCPLPQSGGQGSSRTQRQKANVASDYNEDIDLTYLERGIPSITRQVHAANDPPMVDLRKGTMDMKATRYGINPRAETRGFYGDTRFWLSFQADWYESVIMRWANPTTEMKYVDWNYLRSLASLIKEVVDEVYAECTRKRFVHIMAFKCDWNEEVIAQFYVTLHIDDDRRLMY